MAANSGRLDLAEAIVDPRLEIHEMRMRKSADEIAIMQRAADISLEAHRRAAGLARDGRYEYELEAELGHVFRASGGAGPAYGSIVGGGVNATILHYIRNDQRLSAGDLVLIDAGVELEGYASDVTRTYPVDGKFEPAARDVYEIVLAAQLAAIEASGPGRTLPEVHDAALRVLCEGLVTLGILEGGVDEIVETETYKPYYMHGTSHWLGLDVHDVGAYVTRDASGATQPRKLEPGMAYTIEPGLYIAVDDPKAPAALKGLGVRIEDDVVITEDGILNLNRDIPKTVDAIEAWVRGT